MGREHASDSEASVGPGLWMTCPHCGEKVEGPEILVSTEPPEGLVYWTPTLRHPGDGRRL